MKPSEIRLLFQAGYLCALLVRWLREVFAREPDIFDNYAGADEDWDPRELSTEPAEWDAGLLLMVALDQIEDELHQGLLEVEAVALEALAESCDESTRELVLLAAVA